MLRERLRAWRLVLLRVGWCRLVVGGSPPVRRLLGRRVAAADLVRGGPGSRHASLAYGPMWATLEPSSIDRELPGISL
jgi:hypothetical protein